MKKTHTHKGLACLIALTVALSAAFFTTGCASAGDQSERSITKSDVLTALEITAALTIGDDLRKAETALRIVADARRYIREDERLTAEGAITYITEQALRSTSLTPSEQIAIRAFVDRFQGNFAVETQRVGISPEIVVTVNEALDAIDAVAREIQTYGAPASRTYSTALPNAGASLAKTAEPTSPAPTRTRQDLVGHLVGWQEPNPAYAEKWARGMRHMLANPQPLPAKIAEHLAR